ncbi:hypothetical protein GH984_10230 [Spiribacter sp. C176]|uniref:Uncharacterized protein n=1 Tax=Spiribacter salilacus TaxID=2664894 RepID=A0A6N7QXL2_9GAMM|nr:hypothetical protein [Spiribacter salilacus]
MSRILSDDSALNQLHKAAAVQLLAEPHDPGQLNKILESINLRKQELVGQFKEKFPPDPPHRECRHAELRGVKFQNGTLPRKGDYRYLLTWGHEKLHLWTHTKNSYTGLVAEVDESVNSVDIWRTFGEALKLAIALNRGLESFPQTSYQWIYRFDPSLDRSEQHYGPEPSSVYDEGAEIIRIRQIYEVSSQLELLQRSEPFFVAVQNLIVAMENHQFCQDCALVSPERRMHDHSEPEKWEQVIALPKMETAIVQATRAVEGLLGQPGDRSTPQKRSRVEDRWQEAVDINCDEVFSGTGMSYLDYYYFLFNLRGSSAHSRGFLSFSLTRQLAVQAQTFAWKIVIAHFQKHRLAAEDAVEALKMNQDLIESEPESWSTPLTAENKHDIPFAQ